MRKFSDKFNKYLGSDDKTLSRMADDMGPFRGIMGYRKQYVPTGEIIADVQNCNTVTNLSKSTVIRLLGLGTTPWNSVALNPYELGIARMRFGNNTRTVPEAERKYLYYDIEENSRFDVATLSGVGVGGDISKATYGSGFSFDGIPASVTKRNIQASDGFIKLEASGSTGAQHQYKTFAVFAGARPPAHYSLKIEFMSGGAIKETVFFNSAHNWLGTGLKVMNIPYVRAASGSPATKIVTKSGNSPITYRGADSSVLNWDIDPYATPPGATMLFYDYTDGNKGTWKLLIDEYNSAAYETIKISWVPGKHNVINNIIPRLGVNKGVGANMADRYTAANGDSYSVVSTREYRDCDIDFIDDYSVTFAINMTANDGNGNASSEQNQMLNYTQGYLFNGRDEMFSCVQLSGDKAFEKNSKFAYYITWQILAPIN